MTAYGGRRPTFVNGHVMGAISKGGRFGLKIKNFVWVNPKNDVEEIWDDLKKCLIEKNVKKIFCSDFAAK